MPPSGATLPPRPAAAFRLEPLAWALAFPIRGLLTFAVLVTLGIALGRSAIGFRPGLAVACVLGFVAWAAWPARRLVAGTALHAAFIEADRARVLELTRQPDGWKVGALDVPLATLRLAPASGRAIGYVVARARDGVLSFLPLAALTRRTTRAMADPSRMPEGYFRVLELAVAGRNAISDDDLSRLFDAAAPARPFTPAFDIASTPSDTTRWCTGVPEVGHAHLTAPERRRLRAAWMLGLAGASLLTLHALTLPIGVVSAVIAYVAREPLAIFAAVLASAIWMLLPSSALRAFRRARWVRAIGRDLTSGFTDVYAGVPRPEDAEDATPMLRAGVILPSPHAPRQLRVTRDAHVLLALDESVPMWPMTLPIARLGNGDDDEVEVALPTTFRHPDAPNVVVTERRLSRAERAEIARHIRGARPLAFAGEVVFILTIIIGALVREGVPPLWFGLVGTVLAVLAAVSFHRWLTQVRLEGDLDDGAVLVVRGDEARGARDEYLASSRRAWRVRDQPASWRHRFR